MTTKESAADRKFCCGSDEQKAVENRSKAVPGTVASGLASFVHWSKPALLGGLIGVAVMHAGPAAHGTMAYKRAAEERRFLQAGPPSIPAPQLTPQMRRTAAVVRAIHDAGTTMY
tara:strand:+ start:385 stop:729 length:345 start_codon:yes stop_codon:yes gene_type:complete